MKVSVATPINRCKGGQFVSHIKALLGLPYDGHTLERVLPELESQIGVSLKRIVADAGYKGHNAIERHKLKVFTSGQKRGVTPSVKRDLKRRAAVEPVIGHLKAEHRMGRSCLAHRSGDANNAILAAVGYNFRLLLNWLRLLWFQSGSLYQPKSKWIRAPSAHERRSSRSTNAYEDPLRRTSSGRRYQPRIGTHTVSFLPYG